MPGVVQAQQAKASRVRGGGAAKVSSVVSFSLQEKLIITSVYQDCFIGILGACVCMECCEVGFYFAVLARTYAPAGNMRLHRRYRM